MSRFLLALGVLVAVHGGVPFLHADEDEVTYSRFLLPVFHSAPVHGAYGSLWESDTRIHYSGAQEAEIVPRTLCLAIQCLNIAGVLSADTPVTPMRPLGASEYPSGALVHVESEHASQVTLFSRIRDISRLYDGAGTEVPVMCGRAIARNGSAPGGNGPIGLLRRL